MGISHTGSAWSAPQFPSLLSTPLSVNDSNLGLRCFSCQQCPILSHSGLHCPRLLLTLSSRERALGADLWHVDLPIRCGPFVRCLQYHRSADIPIGDMDVWYRVWAFCDRVVGVRHG